MKVTFREIVKSEEPGLVFDYPEFKLQVDDEPVWDFKVVNGVLKLIHDPSVMSKVPESVTLGEIIENYGFKVLDMPVQSETVEKEFTKAVMLTYADGSRGIDLVHK